MATVEEAPDALTVGRRIRQLRSEKRMTLDALASAVGRAPSQMSMIENGRREPKLSMLTSIAKALGVTMDELLKAEQLDERSSMEVELSRALTSPRLQAAGVVPFRIPRTLPDEALKAMLALAGEVDRLHDERSATPEEARRANVELRRLMRRQDNYFEELE
ncbi:MAG: helix-turn-helix transcriptional regulator, partial [Microbacterium sp.]